jgi:hypothetical protein
VAKAMKRCCAANTGRECDETQEETDKGVHGEWRLKLRRSS